MEKETIITTETLTTNCLPKFRETKQIKGWYCLSSKTKNNCTAFATYNKPNFIKRFLMKTLLDFYWVKE
jgi:hypothetical protein